MKTSHGFKTVILGLRLGVAMIAGLALTSVASAATYTWTGGGANNNWFISPSVSPYNSSNFSGGPVVSSTTTTDLIFQGSARPSNTNNSSGAFGANSITFNTGVGFTIGGASAIDIGAGGVTNSVGRVQTFNAPVNFVLSSTISVVSGGEIAFAGQSSGSGTLTKTGGGDLSINNQYVGNGLLDATASAGNVNINAQWLGSLKNSSTGTMSVNTGVYVAGSATVNGGYFYQGGQIGGNFTQTSGTVLADTSSQYLANSTFSGGTYSTLNTGTTTLYGGTMNISGGQQAFSQALVTGAITATGGTSSGFQTIKGVTNTGGTLDFNAGGTNGTSDLVFTSGTVSIASTNTGTFTNSQNTVLGAGNTFKLDLNQDGSADKLLSSGALTWGGNLALNLTNSGTVANYTSWDFFDFASQSGNLAGITLGATDTYNGLAFTTATSSGNYFDQKYGAGIWLSDWTAGGQRFIFSQASGVLTVVPEPSTIVFAGIGAAMLGWHTWTRGRRKARMKLIEEHFRRVGEARSQA